jgi:hypothetical protein
MSPPRLFGRRAEQPHFKPEDVLWGIPLREGHSDDNDPAGHRGSVQHAFPLGVDVRAICGYEPPKHPTAGGRPRAALALASDAYNPRCLNCATLVRAASAEAADG